MHQEDGKRTDDVYENIDVKSDGSGKEITNCNASRIQSSELTGSYGVKITSSRVAAVCLLLLCVLLLCVLLVIAVIVLCVTFTQERQQLITKITNFTEETKQILTKITKLTEERDQLLTNNTNLIQLKNQQKNELLTFFKDGWIYYQFSLYYVSNETKNWAESRRYCTERGADLVIINNTEEQDFVNKMSGGSDVWIGLTDSDEEGKWKWVDGSEPTSRFWRTYQPNGGINFNCALNHFGGWADYPCTYISKWICERNLK